MYSRPACAAVSLKVQELSGKTFSTTKANLQHSACKNSRMKRDADDCSKLLDFYQQFNPFCQRDGNTINLTTGIVADDSVNVFNAVGVGMKVINSMQDKTVYNYTFKSSSKAVNMQMKIKISSKNENVIVDNVLLFQRLTAIMLSNSSVDVNMNEIFSHSLCAYPGSLALSTSQLLPANKPDLLKDLLPISITAFTPFPHGSVCVVDGGFLIQSKVHWKRNSTFGNIVRNTVAFVVQHYGINATVVFDGYPNEPTTKDPTHRARLPKSGVESSVAVSLTNKLALDRDSFQAILKINSSLSIYCQKS